METILHFFGKLCMLLAPSDRVRRDISPGCALSPGNKYLNSCLTPIFAAAGESDRGKSSAEGTLRTSYLKKEVSQAAKELPWYS